VLVQDTESLVHRRSWHLLVELARGVVEMGEELDNIDNLLIQYNITIPLENPKRKT